MMEQSPGRRVRILLVFLTVAALWWGFWARTAKDRDVRSVVRSIEEGRRISALVIATSEDEAIDASVLMSYEPPSGMAVLFHVPPTLCLDASLEDGRGNPPAAWTTLESSFARESPGEFVARVKKFFGPELASVSVLPTKNFLRVIDLMGGIFVDVPARISLRTESAGRPTEVPDWIEIPEGEDVFLDSDKAGQYLSYRYDGLGIKGQLFRGRRLAVAFFERAKPHLKQDWFSAQVAANFTGGTGESVMPLARALSEVSPDVLDVRSLPGKSDMNAGVFWMSRAGLQDALPRELKPLIAAGSPQSRITVQILNGSGIPGIAGVVREKLSGFPDIDVVELGNAGRFDFDKTQIIDRGGHLKSAERIRELLGSGVLRQDLNPKVMVDVTVIIGRDKAN